MINDPLKNRQRERSAGRKRSRLLDPTDMVDINDADMLRRFVTDYGKIVPARLTGVSSRQQRRIKHGIKRARNMGMLP